METMTLVNIKFFLLHHYQGGLPFVCEVWYFSLMIEAKQQLQGLTWPLGCINNTTDNNTQQYSGHEATNNSVEID